MKIAASVSIRGKVQGVGFRASTLGKARQLNITGFVKNEANGDVTAFFEGTEAQMEEMLRWCRQGPIRARVTEVETKAETPRNYSVFSIE
jgi:acylphosphatase